MMFFLPFKARNVRMISLLYMVFVSYNPFIGLMSMKCHSDRNITLKYGIRKQKRADQSLGNRYGIGDGNSSGPLPWPQPI